jgi:hypothetical protein
MGPLGRRFVPGRVPGTTMWDLLPRLVVDELRDKLRQQVRALWRAKCFEPEHLPCGVIAIDGKGLGALEHDADGTAQKAHRAHDGTPYWLSRVLRAVLTSSAVKPCLDQMPIDAKTNEMRDFGRFFDALVEIYDALFEIITVDAGMTSRANADRVHAADKAYVMALRFPSQVDFSQSPRRFCGATPTGVQQHGRAIASCSSYAPPGSKPPTPPRRRKPEGCPREDRSVLQGPRLHLTFTAAPGKVLPLPHSEPDCTRDAHDSRPLAAGADK